MGLAWKQCLDARLISRFVNEALASTIRVRCGYSVSKGCLGSGMMQFWFEPC